jgi:IMP dehydrogenase
VVHKNLPPEEQAAQVRRVKKFESGMVVNPLTIHPDQTLAEVARCRTSTASAASRWWSGRAAGLVGIVTNRDVRFASDPEPASMS